MLRFFPTVLLLLFIQIGITQTVLTDGFQTETALKKGEKHLYQLKLKKGAFVEISLLQKGVDVQILLLNAKSDTLSTFDSPNGSTGLEAIEYLAPASGLYSFHVMPLPPEVDGVTEPREIEMFLEENQGDYAIEKVAIMTCKEYQEKVLAEEKRLQSVVNWFGENAVQFKTVEAENGFEDLQFLKPILKDVSIVALGEATHGTREFFQMKHRMLEFLVKEMGYTVFAIEASYAACLNINDYVLYGKGDKGIALASQGFWTWDTEEVLDMIEWMRQYNLTQIDEDKKLKFYGFDVQDLRTPALKLRPLLQKMDTSLSIRFDSLRAIQKRVMMEKPEENLDKYHELTAKGNAILAELIMNEGRLIHKTSQETFATTIDLYRAFLHAWNNSVDYLDRQMTGERKADFRDYYMAENVQYLLNREKPGTKFVLWAHNGHVSSNPEAFINMGIGPMGGHLRERFGEAYYSFAFAFNKGGFQAFGFTGKRGLRGFEVEAAAKPNTDWVLSQIEKPLSITNFRVKLPDLMQTYFEKNVSFFGTGAGFGDDWGRNSYEHLDFLKCHDALIFIDTTTRAIPSEQVKSRMSVE